MEITDITADLPQVEPWTMTMTIAANPEQGREEVVVTFTNVPPVRPPDTGAMAAQAVADADAMLEPVDDDDDDYDDGGAAYYLGKQHAAAGIPYPDGISGDKRPEGRWGAMQADDYICGYCDELVIGRTELRRRFSLPTGAPPDRKAE